MEAGLNSFAMSPTKWISATGAIGIRTKRGRIGSGTFAHVDIAFEFASWISPKFKTASGPGQAVGWGHTSGVLAAEEICERVL